MIRHAAACLLVVGFLAAPIGASAQTGLSITPVADGFDAPWAIGFLPDDSILVTERGGRLWRLAQGARHEITGLGEIAVTGQGGLLDVLVPRDFAQTRALFFTYAKPQGVGSGTAVARATLSQDARHLTGWQVIWEMAPGSSGGRHFGSRIVEAPDGHLFVTIGERGDRPSAQDLSRQNGSVIRISRDGTPPADNPFQGRDGAQPGIWSYGHRNPQGAALDSQGRLWVVEHGARGGDEVNLIEKGANYGWPVISYGTHYSGAKIGEGTSKPGMKQPAFYWDPSIAPSGMTIYTGALFPDWQGDFLIGSLKFDHIARLSGDPLREVQDISTPETARVRDIRQGPDGAIWFLSVGQGALYRMTPD